MRIFRLCALAGIGALWLATSDAAAAQDRTVWNGVYTAEQAARGKAKYEESCAKCHLPDLTGNHGPALVGPRFMEEWGEDALESVWVQMRDFMPRTGPTADRAAVNTVSNEAKIDILSYILQVNGFPAGMSELQPAAVGAIRLQAKDGPPAPLPNFSLVRTVGCLEAAEGDTWRLTRAAELTRARDGEPSADDVLQQLNARPPGALTVKVQDVYPAPTDRIGQRVEVKGRIIRKPGNDSISVSSLATVSASCGK